MAGGSSFAPLFHRSIQRSIPGPADMRSWFKKLPRERGYKLSLAGDCVIIIGASITAAMTSPGRRIDWLVVTGMATAAMLLWGIGGRVLRHYDVWNGRGVRGDF